MEAITKLLTPEFIGVIGVPSFVLIIILIFLGRRIDKIGEKVDGMKDKFSESLTGLALEIREGTAATKVMEGYLREMRDIEREKLSMRKEEKAENEIRKIA